MADKGLSLCALGRQEEGVVVIMQLNQLENQCVGLGGWGQTRQRPD